MKQPRLIVVHGRDRGHEIHLDKKNVVIGRHSSCDLQIVDPEASRRHAELIGQSDQFEICDLGSRHGTFVGSQPIGRRTLKHGDLIRIGRTVLLFLLRITPPEKSSTPEPSQPTLSESSETSLYFRREDLRTLIDRSERRRLVEIAGDLQALLAFGTATQTAQQEEDLYGTPIDLLREAIDAPRGRLDLDGDDSNSDEQDEVCVNARIDVPLQAREKILGRLIFERDEPFRDGAEDLLHAAAGMLSLALDNLRFTAALKEENRRRGRTPKFLGESEALRRVSEMLARVAPVDSTVLLRGESGTGKELAARAIHQQSPRADGPLIAVNCATLSETLLESELFGHERGAFTGAVERKIGKLEAADGGTLFLDEVGEIPSTLQAKLLRVLQEREFERVGGTRPIRVDVRLVAATHRDLEGAIREGSFREDLFYRLNVITVTLPPLRERGGDVVLLARHFAALHGRRLRRREIGISGRARRLLAAYDWPGNVRQLANAMERAVVLGDGEMVRPEDLPEEILDHVGVAASSDASDETPIGDFQAAILETKKKLLLEALDASGGNAAEAARRLGLHPNSLRRLLRRLGLKSSGAE